MGKSGVSGLRVRAFENLWVEVPWGRVMNTRNQHLRVLSERTSGYILHKPKNKHTPPTRTAHQADVSFFSANKQLEVFHEPVLFGINF